MALNFPTDTSQPYFDPVSGLKYIYNSSIGAWETAIQPPAVIFPTAPEIDIPGFLWWDEVAGRLKIWYVSGGSGVWVDATPTPPPVTVNTSQTAPENPVEGDLWWDSINGRLYVYYTDTDGSQWVDASPVPDNGARGNTDISQGTSPPSDPEINDLWFDTTTGNLFIYYSDADSSQWVITQNISSQTEAVEAITTSGPLTVTGTTTNPLITIADATTAATGITRLATAAESIAGTSDSVVLTPKVLKSTIDSYVTAGANLASAAEVSAGTSTTTAVTPAGLKTALENATGYGTPCGTIITFANQTPPTGYLKCDGSKVSRGTYSALFAVIGTTFGIGDGATTFTLPTLTHENSNIIHCIKS